MLRPAAVCRGLLAALEATEGRRKRRKRDQTPDAVGITIKRELLEVVVREDPDPAVFEGWLLERTLAPGGDPGTGAVRAVAMEVMADWRLAATSPEFRAWLGQGAPSDDRA